MSLSLDAVIQGERDHVARPFLRPVSLRRSVQHGGRAAIATPPQTEPVAETKLALLAVCHGDLGWSAEGGEDSPENQAPTKVFAWRMPRSLAATPAVAGDRIAMALADAFGALR